MGSKAKPQTIGFHYKLGVVMALSHSPVDYISEIIIGEKTVWSGSIKDGSFTTHQPELFGGDKKEGGVSGQITVLSGERNQQLNRYVQMFRGETSAQRGLLTVVFGATGQPPANDIRFTNWEKSTLSDATYNALVKTMTARYRDGSAGYLEQSGAITRKAPLIDVLNVISGRSNEEIPDNLLDFYLKELSAGNRTGYAYTSANDDKRYWNNPNLQKNQLTKLKAQYGSNRAIALIYTKFITVDSPSHIYEHGSKVSNGYHAGLSTKETFFKDHVLDVRQQNNPEFSIPFTWGTSPYLKPAWFRVQSINNGWTHGTWYPEKAIIDGGMIDIEEGGQKKKLQINDMNPAHILYKVMTNKDWGMGYNPHDLDEPSFKKAADTLYNERFGMSLLWDASKTIEDFNSDILDAIDGVIRVNVLSGKFELVLIRDDYNIDDLPVLDEDSVVEIKRFERAAWGDSANEIVLTYKDRMEKDVVLTKQNLAAIEIQRGVISSAQTYKGIHTPHIAEMIASRELKLMSSSVAKVSLKVNRLHYLLQNGDVFVLSWEELGIKRMVCRVASIVKGEFDDGTIDIEAVEDIFGVSSSMFAATEDAEGYKDPHAPLTPVPVKEGRVVEASYHDVQTAVEPANLEAVTKLIDEGSTFTMTLVDKPSQATVRYDLYSSKAEQGYALVASDVYFTPVFKLAHNVGIDFTEFQIDGIKNQPPEITSDMYLLIGNECMGIVSINYDEGKVIVRRGILDTLPEYHSFGDMGYIISRASSSDTNSYPVGGTLTYKAVSEGINSVTSINDAIELPATLVGRAARPTPVNSVFINNATYPETIGVKDTISLRWANRNRKMVTTSNVYWGSASIEAEEGQTVNVRLKNPETGDLLFEKKGITDTTIDITPTAAEGWSKYVQIEIETERNKLTSWRDFKWVVSTTSV
jgi:hypothetical protein